MLLFVTIQVIMWSIIFFYTGFTIVGINMCTPREKIWNKLITTGHCLSVNAAFMTTGIFNVVSDFSILILPMFPIWKLKLPPRKKYW